MKKWENPKLESIGVEKTECGGWRYCYQCTNNGYGTQECNVRYLTYTFTENYQCSCGGIVEMVDKYWKPEYCENGTCS